MPGIVVWPFFVTVEYNAILPLILRTPFILTAFAAEQVKLFAILNLGNPLAGDLATSLRNVRVLTGTGSGFQAKFGGDVLHALKDNPACVRRQGGIELSAPRRTNGLRLRERVNSGVRIGEFRSFRLNEETTAVRRKSVPAASRVMPVSPAPNKPGVKKFPNPSPPVRWDPIWLKLGSPQRPILLFVPSGPPEEQPWARKVCGPVLRE